MFYSVPYELIGKEVDVKVSDYLIEIYFNHVRASSHQTLYGNYGQFSTLTEHMPPNHQLYIEQTPEEAIKWANTIGKNTLSVVTFILDKYDVEKQALNSIFTLKKLEKDYTSAEIEEACREVLIATNRLTVKSIQTLIKSNKEAKERQQVSLETISSSPLL